MGQNFWYILRFFFKRNVFLLDMILKMCSLFLCIIYLNSFLLFQCLFTDLDVYMYWITKSTTHMCLFFVTFRLEKKRTFRIKSSGNCKKNQWISQCIVGLYGPPSLSSTRYSKIPEKKVHFRELYDTLFCCFYATKGYFSPQKERLEGRKNLF